MKAGVSARIRRGLLVAGVWVLLLAIGFAAVEFYANRRQTSRFFYEGDRLKRWNRRFYEQRQEFFRNWPVPLEFFDADEPTPRYLYKPSLRMTVRGPGYAPAGPGDPVVWSSNSWGFRGPEFSIAKPPGVFRIVCLGASTTEGSQGDLETYPYFLQQELRRRLPGRRIEVINAGHAAQLIDDLIGVLKLRVVPLNPDVVIFYEVSNNLVRPEFSRINASCPLASCAQKVYQGVTALLYHNILVYRTFAQRFGRGFPPRRPLWHEFDDTSPKPSAARYGEALRRLVRAAKDQGVSIMLSTVVTLAHDGLRVRREDNPALFEHMEKILYPFTPGEIRRMYEHYNRVVREVAKESGVPVVDVELKFPREVKYFPFDDIHFSPEGNRILARIFADHLDAVVRSRAPEARTK
jgi:lysophospholipase L1-like esterase